MRVSTAMLNPCEPNYDDMAIIKSMKISKGMPYFAN